MQDLTENAKSFINTSIRFSSLFLDHGNFLDTILWSKKNKIIIYLDSLECTSCSFNEIRKWKVYNKQLERLNTDIIIVCNHPDVNAVRDVKKKSFVDYSLFFDVDKQFKFINNIPPQIMFQTFVIGSVNQVIWVGLPIRSENTWNDFCSMIKQINTQ